MAQKEFKRINWLKTPMRLKKANVKISNGILLFYLVLNGVFCYIIDLTLRYEKAGVSQPVFASIFAVFLNGLFAGFILLAIRPLAAGK